MSRRCEGRRLFKVAIGNLPCKAVRARLLKMAGNHLRAFSTSNDESGDGLCAYPRQVAATGPLRRSPLLLPGGSCNACILLLGLAAEGRMQVLWTLLW